MDYQSKLDLVAAIATVFLFIGPLVLTVSWVGALIIAFGLGVMMVLFGIILLSARRN